MEQKYLGRTGVRVSELCLGAMTFAREADVAASRQMLDRFLEAGGTFIDTANSYAGGGSEELLGRWLEERGRRYELVIATKVRFRVGDGPNDVGLTRKHIVEQVRASLRRLRTDYVDLLQIHGWDPGTPIEETLQTLDQLIRDGSVRYVGASNLAGWHLERAMQVCAAHGWEPFVTVQSQYNLITRGIEWEVLPVCREHGLGLLPWGPLAGGWLTGKQVRGEGPTRGTRVETATEQQSEAWRKRDRDQTWSVIEVIRQIASDRSVGMAQVALNWVRSNSVVTAPILGARTIEQLEDNLGCLEWTLSSDELSRLDAASALEAPYPYEFIARTTTDRLRLPA